MSTKVVTTGWLVDHRLDRNVGSFSAHRDLKLSWKLKSPPCMNFVVLLRRLVREEGSCD